MLFPFLALGLAPSKPPASIEITKITFGPADRNRNHALIVQVKITNPGPARFAFCKRVDGFSAEFRDKTNHQFPPRLKAFEDKASLAGIESVSILEPKTTERLTLNFGPQTVALRAVSQFRIAIAPYSSWANDARTLIRRALVRETNRDLWSPWKPTQP